MAFFNTNYALGVGVQGVQGNRKKQPLQLRVGGGVKFDAFDYRVFQGHPFNDCVFPAKRKIPLVIVLLLFRSENDHPDIGMRAENIKNTRGKYISRA